LSGAPEAAARIDVLASESDGLMSAGTRAEALIVARGRNVGDAVAALIEGLGMTISPVIEAGARRTAQASAQWGKGVHSAGLTFGDGFAHAPARAQDGRLLYTGAGFAKTDPAAVRA
jgi:ribonuclease VapC